jgi:hypothetical protein
MRYQLSTNSNLFEFETKTGNMYIGGRLITGFQLSPIKGSAIASSAEVSDLGFYIIQQQNTSSKAEREYLDKISQLERDCEPVTRSDACDNHTTMMLSNLMINRSFDQAVEELDKILAYRRSL